MWLHRTRLLRTPTPKPHTIVDAMRHAINLQQQRLPLCTKTPARTPTFQTRAPTLVQRAAAVAVSDDHQEELASTHTPSEGPTATRLPRTVIPSATSVGARLAAATITVRSS